MKTHARVWVPLVLPALLLAALGSMFVQAPWGPLFLVAVLGLHLAVFAALARFGTRFFFGAWFLFAASYALFSLNHPVLFFALFALVGYFDFELLREFFDRASARVHVFRVVRLGLFTLFTTATSAFASVFLDPALVLGASAAVLGGSAFVSLLMCEAYAARGNVLLSRSQSTVVILAHSLLTGEIFFALSFLPLHHVTLGALMLTVDGGVKYLTLQAFAANLTAAVVLRIVLCTALAGSAMLASFFFSVR